MFAKGRQLYIRDEAQRKIDRAETTLAAIQNCTTSDDCFLHGTHERAENNQLRIIRRQRKILDRMSEQLKALR